MVLPTDEVGKPSRLKTHHSHQSFHLNTSLMADSTYNASNDTMSALRGMVTTDGLTNTSCNNLRPQINHQEFVLNHQHMKDDQDSRISAVTQGQTESSPAQSSRVKSAPYSCSERAMVQGSPHQQYHDDEALTSAVYSVGRLAGRFDRACLLTETNEVHRQQTQSSCDIEQTASTAEADVGCNTLKPSRPNSEGFELTNENFLLNNYLDEAIDRNSKCKVQDLHFNHDHKGVVCSRRPKETDSPSGNVTLEEAELSVSASKFCRPSSARYNYSFTSNSTVDECDGPKHNCDTDQVTLNSILPDVVSSRTLCSSDSCQSSLKHEADSTKTSLQTQLSDARQNTSQNHRKATFTPLSSPICTDVDERGLEEKSKIRTNEVPQNSMSDRTRRSHLRGSQDRVGSAKKESQEITLNRDRYGTRTELESGSDECSGDSACLNDQSTDDGMDFDVYNLDTSLQHLNWEKFEQQLQIALEKEEQGQKKNDREEIRRRLASDVDDSDLPSFCRPTRRSVLTPRSHYGPGGNRTHTAGSSLQVCFLNEASASLEAELDNDQAISSGSLCGTLGDLEKQLKVSVSQSMSTSRERSPFDYQSSSPSPTATLLASCRMSLSSTWPGEDTDFVTRQARLQAEARLALAQVRPLARMQLLLEKQAKRKSAIAEIIGAEMFEDGKLKKLTRSVLQYMNYGQLQVLVNDLHAQIESHNIELMQLLQERDDLHMAQDSMLVDIEDLTRRAKEYEARIRRSRNLSETSQ